MTIILTLLTLTIVLALVTLAYQIGYKRGHYDGYMYLAVNDLEDDSQENAD